MVVACVVLGMCRATVYRQRKPKEKKVSRCVGKSYRALQEQERQKVLDTLHSKRFVNQSPREVYATLLDEGVYLCAIRTMYRILAEVAEVRERRDQARRPNYQKPELLATRPNKVWSWDITKLIGPGKWIHYCLYVILDIFSRYVVGWMVNERENAQLAEHFIRETCRKQGIQRGELTIHADRGSSMTSKTVALLLSDLGVIKTHSRPQVSNDNPFSESQFKTMKYCPQFPDRFGSIQDARAFCQEFFAWYNNQHHHSALGLLTPSVVHHGAADQFIAQRQNVLQGFYGSHPERFVHGSPKPVELPKAVWINPPTKTVQHDAPESTIPTQVIGNLSRKEAVSKMTELSWLAQKNDRVLVEAIH